MKRPSKFFDACGAGVMGPELDVFDKQDRVSTARGKT